MDREQLMQLQMIEQEAIQLNQQFQLIEQNISEIRELGESLEEIHKSKDKNILINIGKKIFIPVKVKDEKLVVDVGNKKLIRKTIPETKQIINEQLMKLDEQKTEVLARLQQLELEMNKIIRYMNEEAEKEHEHGDECKHEHEHKH